MNGVQVKEFKVRQQEGADIQMLLATVTWDLPDCVMKSGLESMQEIESGRSISCLEFAFIAAGLLFHRRLFSMDRGTLIRKHYGDSSIRCIVLITYGVQTNKRHPKRDLDKFGCYFCINPDDHPTSSYAG